MSSERAVDNISYSKPKFGLEPALLQEALDQVVQQQDRAIWLQLMAKLKERGLVVVVQSRESVKPTSSVDGNTSGFVLESEVIVDLLDANHRFLQERGITGHCRLYGSPVVTDLIRAENITGNPEALGTRPSKKSDATKNGVTPPPPPSSLEMARRVKRPIG